MDHPDPWATAHNSPDFLRPPNPHLVATLDRLDLTPGGRALDLGCGSGRHLPVLAGRGLHPFGLDRSAAALDKSRRFAEVAPLAQATVGRLPFADKTFDLVVAWGVLFHLSTDQLLRALGDIRRVLSAGGTAILHALDPSDWRRDPNAGPAHRREIAGRASAGVADRFYTTEEIAAMLAPHFDVLSRELVHTRHDYGLSAEWIFVAAPHA
jgi:SAM-dependent methyltransferase